MIRALYGTRSLRSLADDFGITHKSIMAAADGSRSRADT